MCIIAFLSHCLAHTFTPGWELFESFMSLGPRGTFFSLSVLIHCIIAFHLISLFVLFISSHCLCYSSHLLYPICCSFRIIFFHLDGWSSSVHYMEGSHVISTIYPTDIDPGILSLRRSPHQREFMLHWQLRVCLYIFGPCFGFSLYAFRACTVCIYVK